jgi:predicted adenylyl cyclase CyaB
MSLRPAYLRAMHVNFECKASCSSLEAAEQKLKEYQPRYIGQDHQVDTYFNVGKGRLKLREGNIEHALIHYERANIAGAKQSNVILYQHKPSGELKQILTTALGIKTIVDKKRRIYFIDNVKFHFDEVQGLGNFLEIEAIDAYDTIGMTMLKEQCSRFAGILGIREEDYLADSYSDMLLKK